MQAPEEVIDCSSPTQMLPSWETVCPTAQSAFRSLFSISLGRFLVMHVVGFLQMKQLVRVWIQTMCWDGLGTFEAESVLRRFWLSMGKSREGLPL